MEQTKGAILSESFPEPKAELPRLQALWESGHPDRAGIEMEELDGAQ